MTIDFAGLAAFGWSHHFHMQLQPGETGEPARVAAVHRDALEVIGPGLSLRLPPLPGDDEERPTVGDWLMVDRVRGRAIRRLERRTLFKRRAAGTASHVQPIAANVDTLVVVTSCNHDFNPARIERYLALARETGVTPVVVLTKVDLAEDAAGYAAAARRIMPGLLVEALDARDPEAAAVLTPWCAPGQTVALLGSSGVGKSTLVNTLAGAGQATASIREDDSRGRHTTSGRSLHRLAAGGWLIDTPGMRELQLADAAAGIDAVFADITALAVGCRFADCRHENEPGCRVQAAITAGELDPARLARHRKLLREDARNVESIHERHRRDQAFGRMVRDVLKDKRDRRGD